MPSRKNGQIRKKPWSPSAEQVEIWEKFDLRGMRLVDIAKEHGDVTRQSISATAERVRRWLAKQKIAEVDEIRRQHTAYLANVYREAMGAWQRSLEDGEETIVSEKGSAAKRSKQSGNATHLNQARGALQDIRDIWGVDAVVKDETKNDKLPIVTILVTDREQAEQVLTFEQARLGHEQDQS